MSASLHWCPAASTVHFEIVLKESSPGFLRIQSPVMAHTLNDEPYRIQAFKYKPESEPERESEETETLEETCLQQDVSEW